VSRNPQNRRYVWLALALAIFALLVLAPGHVASHQLVDAHHPCALCLWYVVVGQSLAAIAFSIVPTTAPLSSCPPTAVLLPVLRLAGARLSRAPPLV